MRIAIIGYAHPFGVTNCYGAERVIWYLMNELRKNGHDIVVFSVEGCQLPGFEYINVKVPWHNSRDIYYEAIKNYEASTGKYFDLVQSYMSSGFIDPKLRSEYVYCLEPFMGFHNHQENIISYSNKMDSVHGGNGTVIYYGLPEEKYWETGKSEGYLTWIGRMDPGKAPDIAIEVAKRIGKRLVLMGPAYHYPYFVDKIWPQIDNEQIIWLRGVNDDVKIKVFKNSEAFLSTNFNQYHEMLGIVNIEALACGCPVIGWANVFQSSAMNHEGGEIIDHGVQGFLNEYPGYTEEAREASINNAINSLGRINEIDRMSCRQRYLDRFTAKIMGEKHMKYYEILNEKGTVYKENV